MSAGPQIVVWANEDLPPWQRDAVRRLLTSHELTDEDRKELLTMAKVAGEKIEDGDLVLVRQQATANDGDVVVALIDGEATIKRLARASGYFVLKPDSTIAEHRPIVVDRDFHIQGTVVRVLKRGSVIIN